MAEAKQRKHQRPQLRVVLDTNILFTDSASDLVRQEAANLIKESAFPDLEIQWYLPEMVRHERQYQMQKRALELLPPLAKVERLLGHNLAINEQTLVDSVDKVVSQRLGELGLLSLVLDNSKVNWQTVAIDAVYRRPPFKDGETEKGFRDRIIVECFLQLVDASPKTARVCRIVLVSGDRLVAQAVEARSAGSNNTNVVSTLEELKGLINTLVSQVDETFLALLKPKAEKLFFIPKEESSLFLKEQIRTKLEDKFVTELAALPPGASSRTNGTWRISRPNFVKKTGTRIQWSSRITIEVEASKPTSQWPAIETPSLQSVPLNFSVSDLTPKDIPNAFVSLGTGFEGINRATIRLSDLSVGGYGVTSKITTHKGTDVYEVLWSADVTTKRELRRPSIDDIRHGEPTWEQTT